MIGDREAVILAGSGNLTQAGFMTNVELFDVLHVHKQNPAESGLLESVRGFVQGLAAMWPPADAQHLLCVEMLGKMEQALADLPVGSGGKNGVRFIHSFAGPLIDQMPDVRNCDRLFVAAPYFGQSVKGLGMLTKRFSPLSLRVFPAVQGEGTDIPLKQIGALQNGVEAARLDVPDKRKDAFRHFKLYGITTRGKDGWLFCASANCTEAAWGGENVEAGLLRPVPASILTKYFTADHTPLPKGRIPYVPDATGRDVLHFWASDSGLRLEIVVAESSMAKLPLRQVTVTVRSGSGVGRCEKDILFRHGRTAYIDWSAFADWRHAKKMAVFVELQGTTVSGDLVQGQCFVENRLLLTAEPIHRSAWRGALALLGEEGMPEMSDIAAIFTLAQDLFDGTLVRRTESTSTGKKGGDAGSETEDRVIAAWPPQPDPAELQKRLGNTGAGRLQWFQQILRTFLQAEATEKNGHSSGTHMVLDDGEDVASDNGSDDSRGSEEREQNQTIAERLWAKAGKDYAILYERLYKLEPDPHNAPNIWTVAIFAYLSTIAVFRAANRMAPGTNWETSAGSLCDDFLALMLSERRQHDDYCCPKGSRYRSEKFTALFEDLRKTFRVQPHHEATTVMLALLTDKKLRWSTGGNPAFGRPDVGRVCAPGFIADTDTVESSVRIWKRYLMEPSGGKTEADFMKAFTDLTADIPHTHAL